MWHWQKSGLNCAILHIAYMRLALAPCCIYGCTAPVELSAGEHRVDLF